jgi:radical SAM protein with 4Fe4S-binding SPASM domain
MQGHRNDKILCGTVDVKETYYQFREAVGRLFYIIPSRPEVAQIEVTNVCNFDCPMCQRKHLGVELEHMDYDLFKNVVDRLNGVKSVILCGWGEPLCHPRIIDMIRYVKARGLKASLTSNGSLLDEDMQEALINSGIDSISVSIDCIEAAEDSATHAIRNQLDNITAFMEKIKMGDGKPKVILQSTYHKNKEKDILKVMEYAAKTGIKEVNVNRLDIRFNPSLNRPSYEEEREFVGKMINSADELGITAEFRCHTAFSGLKRWIARKLIPLFHGRGRHCLRVYNYVYITLDGHVTPCCALPRYHLGNMVEEDLVKIWNNKSFKKFRQTGEQRKVCGKCDVLEIRQRSGG